MSRVRQFHPDELTEPQRELYAAIAGGPRAAAGGGGVTDAEGRLVGPFNAMLLSPVLGGALQEVGSTLRYRGALSPRCRELAILVVAAHWRSRFEQDAHERIAAQVGFTRAELDALRAGGPLPLGDAQEAAVLAATRTLVRTDDLSQPDYDAAASTLGPAKVFELTTLVGYYSLLALQMRVFGVSRPPEPTPAARD
jgi:4-carboxymuconolactone decarboxylase